MSGILINIGSGGLSPVRQRWRIFSEYKNFNSRKASPIGQFVQQLLTWTITTTKISKLLISDPWEGAHRRHRWFPSSSLVMMSLKHVHAYFRQVEPEVGPMVDQLQCGRCWAFSAFNAMRIPVAKALNVSEFEFSCNHLFFWNTVSV